MARTNRCRVCGWTGEPDGQRRWLGTNHNLCSACVVTCDRCKGTGILAQTQRTVLAQLDEIKASDQIAQGIAEAIG
jgi:DnaJ-class molecular chaperone